MTDTVKKQLSTPKLRIFVRTRAEERVLSGCKLIEAGSSPGTYDDTCLNLQQPMLAECYPCSSLVGS